MKNIGILPWWNENALTPYPLTSSFGYNGFLVDASFVQFDNFIPTLNSLTVDDTKIVLTLTIDVGSIDVEVDTSSLATQGYTKKIYDNSRYVGSLVFGINAYSLANNDIANQTLKDINIKFLSVLVKSIPSDAGVYSIQNKFGSVVLDNSDGVITYVLSDNEVTINAISYPPIKTTNFLKTINGVSPQDNNLYLLDNEIIKYKTSGTSELEILLVGSPTEGTIITNG